MEKMVVLLLFESMSFPVSTNYIVTNRVLRPTVFIFSMSSPGHQRFFPWTLMGVSSERTLSPKFCPLGKAVLCVSNFRLDLTEIETVPQ